MTLGAVALAADPEVPVQADVVFASTAAGTVEPTLIRMRDAMASKVKYQTLRKVESKTLTLVKDRPQNIALPNKKSAEVVLQKVEANVATVKVKVPPTEAVYQLAREKVLYVQGGEHDGGQLWLLLSQPK
ncbi:MAG: hypothetical protein DI536_31430 [Archangium gephyra]|uniref:Uncharacterized protein n=1 Tax=Archangium gephyra TaxID=48 RepID=A0A2W5URX5_9BACT|nr:MAG: hypothetical protein DI536_31430 [Archangium gephyra]